ncbi:MAG: hypothetical protein ACPGVZ_17855 [Myxococcota bacterium]
MFRSCSAARTMIIFCMALLFLMLASPAALARSNDEGRSRIADKRGHEERRGERAGKRREKGPRAKLRVKSLEEGAGGLTWFSLDARKSNKRRPRPATFSFSVRNLESGRLLPGPGSTPEAFVQVLLPAGKYEATLRVRDAFGRSDEKKRKFKVEGTAANLSAHAPVEWAYGRARSSARVTYSFQRSPGPMALGLVDALISRREGVGALGSSGGGGCGKRLNNAGNGIGVVSGVLNVGVTLAAPEYKVAADGTKVAVASANSAGAGMKIAGGNSSGACTQAKIDKINEQLAFQQSEIEDIYNTIGRDQEAFFFALTQLESQIIGLQQDLFSERAGNIKSLLDTFMTKGALWDENTLAPWMVVMDGQTTNVPLSLLSIASCELDSEACCAGARQATDYSCLNSATGNGPMEALRNIDATSLMDDLQQITGSALIGDCDYDCWKNITAVSSSASATLLQIYDGMAERLFDAFVLCTAEEPSVRANCPNYSQSGSEPWAPPSNCSDDDTSGCSSSSPDVSISNDVVPLFDQYNDAIGSYYLQAIVALNQAYSIEQLVNLYNYNRYVGSLCGRGDLDPSEAPPTQECEDLLGQTIPIRSIDSYSLIAGTHYEADMIDACGTGLPPETPQEHADAFNCAQTQLGLVYAQRVNLLYQATLNHTITDGIVGRQSYPESRIAFPSALSDLAARLISWNQDVEGGGIGAAFDYEEQLGKSLPPLMQGARTPKDLLERVAGEQTNSGAGYNWSDDGTLYQAYQVADAATCINTLLAYNASDHPDAPLDNVYTSYEQCPSIFALPDDTGVVEGYFDGITVQPYTFRAAPGGPGSCPSTCRSCESGLANSIDDYVPGGRGLITSIDGTPTCAGFCSEENVCGDYRFAQGDYTDCSACDPTVAGPSDDWFQVGGDNGSWADSCSTNTAVFEEVAGVPALSASCTRINGSSMSSGPVTCGDARWGNNDGTLFCEGNPEGSAGFALSPPMGGNVRLCDRWEADKALQADAYEGATGEKCSGEIYYGKRYVNSLDPTLSSPGSGSEAGFSEMISDSAYLIAPASQSYDCTNDSLGRDPAPGFYKQCFCVDGNQLTWIRPAETNSASTYAADSSVYSALPEGLSYLSCGNFVPGDSPGVVYEYAATGGAQEDADNDQPPTIFRETTTQSDRTFESDIGIRSTNTADGAGGVNYQVTFANLDSDCNTPDNTQLDIYFDGLDGADCSLLPRDPSDVGTDHWTTDAGPPSASYAARRCLTQQFPVIRNSENDESAFMGVLFEFPSRNAVRASVGPSIPVDIVWQCSEGSDSTAPDCQNQSQCMHMVTHGDANWTSASLAFRVEAMSKRGYICQSGGDQPDEKGNCTACSSASMYCEVPDGRVFRFKLENVKDTSNVTNDRRARIVVSEL